ncbi:hypothetical protein MKX03_007640, partial [Papaver bracteatum]
VTGDGKSELVDGTRIGGIACWGLGRLFRKCKWLYIYLVAKLSNAPTDMNIGSFGKIISENRTLEDCKAADISLSLLIGDDFAKHWAGKLQGSFIKDNTCALEALSSSCCHNMCILIFNAYSLLCRTNGAAKAMFLRHKGFVGALGALMCYENKHGLLIEDESQNAKTT